FVGEPGFFEGFEGGLMKQYHDMLEAEPALAVRFKNAEPVWSEPKTLQSWSATTDTFFGEGFVLTGNVTEFLDPVFSSGVTLAAVSAQKAANLVIRKLNGKNVDWQKEYMDPMRKGTDVFRTYVNGWYDGSLFNIFFAPEPDL